MLRVGTGAPRTQVALKGLRYNRQFQGNLAFLWELPKIPLDGFAQLYYAY